MSGDAQRHFDAAQTHIDSYYAHFGPVMDSYCHSEAQNVHNMQSKCVWASSISFDKKDGLGWGQTRQKEAGSTFVLPPTGTSVFLWGEILPNFDLQNVISTSTKNFAWEKNGLNSPDFEEIKIQITRFSW